MSEIKIDWWKLYVTGKDVPNVPEDLLSDDFLEICEWAEKIAVASERERAKALHSRLYNSGYRRGHHDTVESGYVDIHHSDMDSYHENEVSEIVEDFMNAINQEGA